MATGTFLALRSLGSLIAPPLGGWLYLVGGFALPFVAFGALLVVACLPVMRLILLSPPPTLPLEEAVVAAALRRALRPDGMRRRAGG